MYVLRDGLPPRIGFLRQDMNAHEVLFLRWLGEILDLEQIPPPWLGVPNPKVEPLLMALCISINLHVQIVLCHGDQLSTE